MVHIVLPVEPHRQQPAAGKGGIVKEGALVEEQDDDKHRAAGGEQHEDAHAVGVDEAAHQGHHPKHPPGRGQGGGQRHRLPAAGEKRRPDGAAGEDHHPGDVENLEKVQQPLGRHRAKRHVHICLLQQKQQQLQHHHARKPEEHPIKDLVVLILAARTLSLVEHCHPSFIFDGLRERPLHTACFCISTGPALNAV